LATAYTPLYARMNARRAMLKEGVTVFWKPARAEHGSQVR